MLHYVQVCTGVMLHGYPLVKSLCGDLQARTLCCTHVAALCRYCMLQHSPSATTYKR